MGQLVRLPTAAARRVRNSEPAARIYRRENPWPGRYVLPTMRELCARHGLRP